MQINIKMKNSTLNGRSKSLNDIQTSDNTVFDISLEDTHVNDDAELLNGINNLDNDDTEKLLEKILLLENKTEILENEYRIIQKMKEEKLKQQSPKSILKKYLPDLMVGTLVNVISSYITHF